MPEHAVSPPAQQRASAQPSLEVAASELAGRGRPLPAATRAPLERASGRLLGHVRLHDDALAGSLAEAVSARAVTIGGDVALGVGSSGHPDVLAHELAHAADLSGTPQQGPLTLSEPGDAVEERIRQRVVFP